MAFQTASPFQNIDETLADQSGGLPEDVEVKRWVEGDYDWVSATRKFSDLTQAVQMLESNNLFNRFSLTHNRGIFQDEFVLDAELLALGADVPPNDFGVDPASLIDMTFSARLPGTIVETDGVVDPNDPNRITWKVDGYQTVSVKARSLSLNWVNILGMLTLFIAVVVVGIYVLGNLNSIFYPSKRGTAYLPANQPALQVPPPASQPSDPKVDGGTNYIVELGVEDLLNQVNLHVLKSAGELRKQTKEIALIWKDGQGAQRFIYVKDLGNHEIAINGKNYPATRDNVKSGIMNVLKK